MWLLLSSWIARCPIYISRFPLISDHYIWEVPPRSSGNPLQSNFSDSSMIRILMKEYSLIDYYNSLLSTHMLLEVKGNALEG